MAKVGMVGLALLVSFGAGAKAADWSSGLFSETKHDFGPVPRGAKVRHNFILTNNLTEPITILDVRASCGCTTGRTTAKTVPPGQSAVVEAEMDTRNFVGRKVTTLFVSVVTLAGKEGEARLTVASNILSDIVLNPGSLDFGVVTKGQSPTLSLTIDRLGAPDWRVDRMLTSSRSFSGSIHESTRNSSSVSYELTLSIRPDVPAGPIREEIRVLTNDKESPVVPILVTAQVRGDLVASPSSLPLGRVAKNGTAHGRVLVRGARPFSIKAIEGNGDGFVLQAAESGAKALHILNLSYRPDQGTTRGDVRRAFRVVTDLPGEPPLDVSASLHVDP